MRGATGVTLQHHQILLRLPRISEFKIWARNPWLALAMDASTSCFGELTCPIWARHFVWKNTTFALRLSPSNITKYCACHQKGRWWLIVVTAETSRMRGASVQYSARISSTGLYSTLLYSSLLFSTLLFSTVLFSTLLYYSLLLSTTLYSLLLSTQVYSTLLYNSLSRLKLRNSEVCHPNFLWLQLSLRSPQKTSFTIPTPYKHMEKKQLLSFMKFLCQLPNSCSSKPFSSIHQISLTTPRLTADPGSWSRNRLSTSCNASNQEDGVSTSVLKHPVRPTAWGKTQPPNCQKSKHEFLLLNPSQITCRKYFFPWLLIKGCISNTLFWGERRW